VSRARDAMGTTEDGDEGCVMKPMTNRVLVIDRDAIKRDGERPTE